MDTRRSLFHLVPNIIPIPPSIVPPPWVYRDLVGTDLAARQILFRLLYLSLQLDVGIVCVVEGEDTKAKSAEEVCGQGDDSPERQHRDDVVLYTRREYGWDRRVLGQQWQRK